MRTQDTNTTKITLLEDGLIEIKLLKSNNAFDLEEAKKQREVALSFVENNRYLVLVDTRDATVQPTKEAQKFLIGIQERKAEAIVVSNLAYRILASFYFSKMHNHPTKIFTNYDKALNWLRTFKEKE